MLCENPTFSAECLNAALRVKAGNSGGTTNAEFGLIAGMLIFRLRRYFAASICAAILSNDAFQNSARNPAASSSDIFDRFPSASCALPRV